MERGAAVRRVARPRKPKPVPRKKPPGGPCKCLSVAFTKTDWGRPVVKRELVDGRAYTFLRIRVTCKYTIKCAKTNSEDPCFATLTPSVFSRGTSFPGLTLLSTAVNPRTVRCEGEKCDGKEKADKQTFDVVALFEGEVDTIGTVTLNLGLSGCDANPRAWTMKLKIVKSGTDTVVDARESDYDGDGKLNKDETGDDNPEWDPDRK
jgi:hypothetical protein